jgi:hypothetical protein
MIACENDDKDFSIFEIVNPSSVHLCFANKIRSRRANGQCLMFSRKGKLKKTPKATYKKTFLNESLINAVPFNK